MALENLLNLFQGIYKMYIKNSGSVYFKRQRMNSADMGVGKESQVTKGNLKRV